MQFTASSGVAYKPESSSLSRSSLVCSFSTTVIAQSFAPGVAVVKQAPSPDHRPQFLRPPQRRPFLDPESVVKLLQIQQRRVAADLIGRVDIGGQRLAPVRGPRLAG